MRVNSFESGFRKSSEDIPGFKATRSPDITDNYHNDFTDLPTEPSPKRRSCDLATTVSIEAGQVSESVVEACGHCVFLGNTRSLSEEDLHREVHLPSLLLSLADSRI